MGNKWLYKFIPSEYKDNIHEIDYSILFEKGFRILLFDLDNTIADYDTHDAPIDKVNLIESLKQMGFRVILLSNNKVKRITVFKDTLGVEGYNSLRKPFIFKIKRILKDRAIEISKSVWIGDQAITDILCSHKLNVPYSILVKPIKDSTDHWYTRVNRKTEKQIMKRIKKKLRDKYFETGLYKRYGN